MKQSINRYPHFIANSVLKSKDLNDSFKYLDEQSRLCRAACLESGIINGLTYVINDGKIILHAGEAINSRGWYASIEQDTTYEYAVKVPLNTGMLDSDSLHSIIANGGGLVGYVCFKDKEDALEFSPEPILISSIKNFDSMALALACGKRTLSSASCSELSCNINTEEIRHETWPVLVYTNGIFSICSSNERTSQAKITVEPKPLFAQLSLINAKSAPRRLALSSNMGNRIIFRQTNLKWFSDLKVEAATHIDTILNEIFKAKGEALRTIMGDYKSLENRLKGAKSRINALLKGDQVDHVECRHLFFINDCLQAIGEFIEEYNEFVSRNSIIPNKKNEGCLIYLGKTSSLDSEGECNDITYRSLILHQDARFQEDCTRLTDMLERICLISECFNTSEVNQKNCTKTNKTLKAIICRPRARISDRPIPSYYKIEAGLTRCWNADRLARTSTKTGHAYARKEDLIYLNDSERIFLNGYEGRSDDDVTQYIEDLNLEYNMGISSEIIRLENRRLKKGIKNKLMKLFNVCYFLNVIYEGKKEAVRDVGNMNYKLFDAFNTYFSSIGKYSLCSQTFHEDLDRLTKGQPFSSKKTFLSFRKKLEGINENDIREFCATFYEKKVYDYDKDSSLRITDHAATLAVDTLVRLVNRSCEDKLEGAILGGGIPAGGTVYLLSIGSKCVGYAVKP